MFSDPGIDFGLCGICPGQQVVDLAILMAVDDFGEDV